MKDSTKRRLTAVVAAGLIALGLAAPAMAEGARTSSMTNWVNTNASSSWADANSDNKSTHVTFYDCTREFRSTIRQTIPAAKDPSVGSEWINCRSYDDSVYAGDVKAGHYHFDISGMPCVSYNYSLGYCAVPARTTVHTVKMYW